MLSPAFIEYCTQEIQLYLSNTFFKQNKFLMLYLPSISNIGGID